MSSARTLRLSLLAVVIAATACSTDSAPTAPQPLTPSEGSAGLFSTLRGVTGGVGDALHAVLITQRDSARRALAREAIQERPTYESESAAWRRQGASPVGWLVGTAVGAVTHLLRCQPLPFAGDAEIVGPAGGVLHVGPHTLTVPPGALDHEVLLTATSPVSSLVGVQFGPHGLKFARPVDLELSYSHCLLPIRRTFRVAYVGDDDTVLEFPPSVDSKSQRAVDAAIGHFSSYMIAF